jgi:hypothetical protein
MPVSARGFARLRALTLSSSCLADQRMLPLVCACSLDRCNGHAALARESDTTTTFRDPDEVVEDAARIAFARALQLHRAEEG